MGNWSSPFLTLDLQSPSPPLPLTLRFFGSTESVSYQSSTCFPVSKILFLLFFPGFVLSLWVNAFIFFFFPSLLFSEWWERSKAVRHISSPSLTASSWTVPEILLDSRKHTQKHTAAYFMTWSKPLHLSGPQFPHI